ncbi:MAG: hypothetical protein HYS80_02495, partial [Candidatus Aenigmarchaeota archaeon]|nr:hypothetical protein [Candidatus Aenigmarchaeota archaeon]
IEVDAEGRYIEGKQSIVEYLRQTAMSNPYAEIIYDGPNGRVKFERAVKELPPLAKEIKPHPYGVEIGLLRRMIMATNARNMVGFLTNEFSRVGRGSAEQICKLAKIETKRKPQELNHEETERLHKSMQMVKLVAPPTDCLSPLGEKLLEEGLKKETKAEFVVAVTRPPSVYRGNPFQVECCTGDTKIMLESGRIIEIKEYIENGVFRGSNRVFSMTQDLKIKPQRVVAVHKFENQHKILLVETKSGQRLKVTENNELPTLVNGQLVWKKAEEFKVGELISTPRRIIVNNSENPDILDTLDEKFVKVYDEELVKHLLAISKERFGSFKKLAKHIGKNYELVKSYNRINPGRPALETIRKLCDLTGEDFEKAKNKIKRISYVDNSYYNPVPINVPRIHEDLFYLLGLLDSDGHVTKREISFVNTDQHLHRTFCEKLSLLFGILPKRYKYLESTFSNKTIYHVLTGLRKHLPEFSDEMVSAYLKGIVDGDGWVKLEGDKITEVGIATAKREEAEFVQTMLLRLGIQSKIKRKGIGKNPGYINGRAVMSKLPQYNIYIRDFWNIVKFATRIGFRQQKRSYKLGVGLTKLIESRQQSDALEVGMLLKRFREENSLYQTFSPLSDVTIRETEHSRLITRNNLQLLLNCGDFRGESYEKLKLLAFSDILWDKVVKIEEAPNEEYVYDLTVESGNFVANNIIMHNCALA